jgi:BioD-like phosphotransacetylase family protein
MPVIVVAGDQRGAGATTVAVGLAHRLAHSGQSVHLVRLAGDDRSESDARTFANLDFASGDEAPVAEGDVRAADGVTIIESASATDVAALASRLGARVLRVTRDVSDDPATIQNRTLQAGPRRIAEDRLLAAPTVGALATASRARVLSRSTEGDGAVVEHIVIGAISHDSDQPYFNRFPRKVVVTRSERVDIALSALRTQTECLILTGGGEPSPYLLDRVAASRSTTLLVAPDGTVETVRDIEGMFGAVGFSGDAKIERAAEALGAALNDAAVAALLA